MWITSPATSFVISGLDFSSRWNSPIYCVRFDIPYFRTMLHTRNDVHDSGAKEMSEDGMASINCTEPCHQVVRFVDRAFVIAPVKFQVVMLFVRDALEASLRSCDVLQCDNSRQRLRIQWLELKVETSRTFYSQCEACLMILQVDNSWVGLCCYYLTMVYRSFILLVPYATEHTSQHITPFWLLRKMIDQW